MPGALPLLSFALSELYLKLARRFLDASTVTGEIKDRLITWQDYNDVGGVTRSLTQRADQEYNSLVSQDSAYEQTIRNVMLRMVAVGGELARRQVPESELRYPASESRRVETILKNFLDARLLVTNTDTNNQTYFEPAHDALIRGWDKLLEWQKEEKETLTLQRRLTPAATEWESVKSRNQEQPKSALTRTGSVLNWIDRRLFTIENLVSQIPARIGQLIRRSQQQKLSTRNKPDQFLWNANPYLDVLNRELNSSNNWLNQIESEFVQESLTQRRRNSSWRWRIAIAVILGLSGLTIATLIGQRNAQIGQTRAFRESAEANFKTNEQLNALIESLRAGKSLKQILWADPELHNQVEETLRTMVYGAKERNAWSAPSDRVLSIFFVGDQFRIITQGENNVRVLNQNQEQIAELSVQEDLSYSTRVKGSPDGKKIAILTEKSIHIWDLQGNKFIPLEKPPLPPSVKTFSFSPDGTKFVTTSYEEGGVGFIVSLWDLKGNKLNEIKLITVFGVGFRTNGELSIATSVEKNPEAAARQHIKVIDLAGNQLALLSLNGLATINSVFRDVQFSPNGKEAFISISEIDREKNLLCFLKTMVRTVFREKNQHLDKKPPLFVRCSNESNTKARISHKQLGGKEKRANLVNRMVVVGTRLSNRSENGRQTGSLTHAYSY